MDLETLLTLKDNGYTADEITKLAEVLKPKVTATVKQPQKNEEVEALRAELSELKQSMQKQNIKESTVDRPKVDLDALTDKLIGGVR